MSEFVNRTGTNLNRKVFDVESVQRDGTGEIIQIIGNLFRNDSEGLTQEGTPLEAGVLTEIVNNIASEISKEVVLTGIEETGEIRTKLRSLINTIAINYTDNAIDSLREELLAKMEEIATQIAEKHVRYSVYETEVELLTSSSDAYPCAEIDIPIEERVTIEFVKSYDSLFRYEFGHESDTNFVIGIQALYSPENYGTSEYKLEFALKSEATGELLTKVYVTIVSIETSTTPED